MSWKNCYAIDINGNVITDRRRLFNVGLSGHDRPQGTQDYNQYGIFAGINFFEHNTQQLYGFNDWLGYVSLAGPTRPSLIKNLEWQNVSGILVSYTDANGHNVKPYLDDLDSGTSSVKAHITVSNETNKAEYVTFNLVDISNVNNNYAELVVQSIKANGIGSKPFANGASIGFEFTRSGEKGQKGAQGFTGFQGFQGFKGVQGFTGYQGRTLSWWHNYVYSYDTATSGTPATGKAQRLLDTAGAAYSISESNKADFNLETLVNIGVIRKQSNFPQTGYTTYTLLRDISMNCEIAGWENWSSNTSAPLFWGDYDFTFKHYLHLKEGYIFDGNGFEIRMDHSVAWPWCFPLAKWF